MNSLKDGVSLQGDTALRRYGQCDFHSLTGYSFPVETEQAKIYHHHTPRQYLLPWADADERIAWLGYGKVDRSGLTVVGGENDFYKLKELTDQDIKSIRLFIKTLPEIGWKGHERFLKMYALPTRLKRHLERSGIDNAEAMRQVDVVIANLNENYHASIERKFWPYLAMIETGDISFYDDPVKASEFFHGLAVQFLRTKAIKDRVRKNAVGLFEDVERVWDVLSHMLAVTMGGSLLVSRRDFRIVVVENDTQVPFITSDQPIINMLAESADWSVPERVEFYYPISPTRALLYLEKSTPVAGDRLSVSIDEAHRYNMMMFDHHGLRIFSNSEEYLRFLKQCTSKRR